MGFFLEKFGIKLINEAEVDRQEIENNQQSTDYTDDSNPSNNDQQPADYTEDYESNPQDQNDQNNEDQRNMNDQPEYTNNTNDNQTTDYTEEGMDDQDNSEGGDNSAPPPADDDEDQPVDDIKKQEEELYGNLTPEQLDIKHKELKTQYLSLYDTIITIIDRIGDASINEENIGVAEYISNTLSRMRDMMSDYMNDVYQGKSYIENSINYNRFLSILNGVNKILEEIEKKKDN